MVVYSDHADHALSLAFEIDDENVVVDVELEMASVVKRAFRKSMLVPAAF